MFILEGQYGHLVKTLVVGDIEYKYFDITSVESSYGVFLSLSLVVINVAFSSQSFCSLYAVIMFCC